MTNLSGFNFIAGTQVTLHGRPWVVEPPLGDGRIPLRAADGPDRQLFALDYLLDSLSEGKLEFVDHRSDALKKEAMSLKLPDNEFTKEQNTEVEQFIHYINELEYQGISTYTPEKYKRVINSVADRMGYVYRPSPITLWRRYKDFRDSGRQRAALVKQHHNKGNRQPRFENQVIHDLMERIVEREYLTDQKKTIQETYDALDSAVSDHNQFHPEDPLHLPTYSTLWRYIESLPRQLVVERRDGPKAAEAEFRNCRHSPKLKRILQQVQADHTRLDIVFVDRKRDVVLGPATITLIMDVFSRCIYGIHLSYHAPSALSVAEALKFAVLKKTNLNSMCPSLKHDFPMHGLPELLVVDNGKEFHSTSFLASCAELGIKVRWAKRKKPWWKPHIERLLKTINHSFVHALPGTNFGSVKKKGDYNPTKHAMVDFHDFMAALLVWIVDYYHQKPHRGLGGRTPAQVWEEGVRDFPPSLPRSRDALNAVLGKHATRTIGRMGIEYEHLFYNCEDLQLLRNRFPLRKDADVKIVVDEDNLERITVFDPFDNKPFHVPSLDPEYTRNLTLHQHLVHKRHLAEEGKKHITRQELLEAKERAFAIAKGALCDQESASGKILAARYLGIKQTSQDGESLTNLDTVAGNETENSDQVDIGLDIAQVKKVKPADMLAQMKEFDLNDEGWGSSLDGNARTDS